MVEIYFHLSLTPTSKEGISNTPRHNKQDSAIWNGRCIPVGILILPAPIPHYLNQVSSNFLIIPSIIQKEILLVPNPQPSTTESSGQNSNSHWLDFLSTSNNAPSASTAREVMSWERGGGPPSNNPDLYVERGRPSTAGSPLMAGIVNVGKRSPGGLLTSPLTGVNGRDDGNKETPG